MVTALTILVETAIEIYSRETSPQAGTKKTAFVVKDIFHYLSLPMDYISMVSSRFHPKGKANITTLLKGIGMESVIARVFANHNILLGTCRLIIGSYVITKIFKQDPD